MKSTRRDGSTASHTFDTQGMVAIGRLKASKRREGGLCMKMSLLIAKGENNLEGVIPEVTTMKEER